MARSKGNRSTLETIRGSEIGALAPGHVARLADAATPVELARGKRVYPSGAAATRLWIVSSGRVRVVRLSDDGRETALAHRLAGATVGEWGLFGHGVQRDTAVVAETAQLLVLPITALEPLAGDVRFQRGLARIAADRREAAEAMLTALATRTVRSRLAEFLAECADCDGTSDARGIRIRSRYTHLEIAATVGATRETTTVTLDEMKRKGILVIERRRIIVRDLGRLEALV